MGEYSCEIILDLDQWFRRRCLLKKKFTDGRWTKTDHNKNHEKSPSRQSVKLAN